MSFSEFRAGAGRERRDSAALRARLLWGAHAALLRHGADAGIGEIAAAAGVPQAAVHRCFASKESLVRALVAEVVEGNGAAVERAVGTPEDPAAAVAAFVRQTVRMTERDPLLACLATGPYGLAEALTDDFSRRVLRSLSRGVWVGRFPVASALVQLCAIRGAVLEVLRGRLLGLLPAAAADELAAGVLQMLGLPAGEAAAIAGRPLEPVAPLWPWAAGPAPAGQPALTVLAGRR
jgi:AcrR family transcriptional regulator